MTLKEAIKIAKEFKKHRDDIFDLSLEVGKALKKLIDHAERYEEQEKKQ